MAIRSPRVGCEQQCLKLPDDEHPPRSASRTPSAPQAVSGAGKPSAAQANQSAWRNRMQRHYRPARVAWRAAPASHRKKPQIAWPKLASAYRDLIGIVQWALPARYRAAAPSGKSPSSPIALILQAKPDDLFFYQGYLKKNFEADAMTGRHRDQRLINAPWLTPRSSPSPRSAGLSGP